MKEALHEEVCTGTIPFILSAKTAKINLWQEKENQTFMVQGLGLPEKEHGGTS